MAPQESSISLKRREIAIREEMDDICYDDEVLAKRQKLETLDDALSENHSEWDAGHDDDCLSENPEDDPIKRSDYFDNLESHCSSSTSVMPNCALSPSSTCGSFSQVRSPAPPTAANSKNPLICDDTWNVRLEELTAYKLKHGNCLVPKKSRSNPQLGIWVMNQRAQYKLLKEGKPSTMTTERIRALEELGFIWSMCDHVDWEDRLEELRQYKQKHGDCLVPNKYAENPQLGTWVNKQRTQYKLMMEGSQSSMNSERAAALEALGFVWSKRDLVDWYSRLEELKAYKREHGDCLVPNKYSANPQLGTWVMHQRAQYRKLREGKPSPMTEERVNALEEIGFTWAISNADTDWAERVEDLKRFKAQHGTCLVPNKYPENHKLGAWVGKQRKQYKLFLENKPCNLTQERIRELDEIGFVWSLRSLVDWDARLEELKDYHRKHGNCLVPQQYPENPQLGTWVSNQRKQYRLLKEGKPSPMTEERVQKLEELGFVWSIFSHDAHWDTKLEELKEYKARFGDCLVPEDYKENLNLGVWVKYQRIQYKLMRQRRPSTMTSDRIRELDKLGFVWYIPGEDLTINPSKNSAEAVRSPEKSMKLQPYEKVSSGHKPLVSPSHAAQTPRTVGQSRRGWMETAKSSVVTIRRPQPQYVNSPRPPQGLDEIQPWQRLWQRQIDYSSQKPSRYTRTHNDIGIRYNNHEIRSFENLDLSEWEPLSHVEHTNPGIPLNLEHVETSDYSVRSLSTISPCPADWEQLFEPFEYEEGMDQMHRSDSAVGLPSSSHTRVPMSHSTPQYDSAYPQTHSKTSAHSASASSPHGTYIVYSPANPVQHSIISPQSQSHSSYWESPVRRPSANYRSRPYSPPTRRKLEYFDSMDYVDGGYHQHHEHEVEYHYSYPAGALDNFTPSQTQGILSYSNRSSHQHHQHAPPPPVPIAEERDYGYVSNDEEAAEDSPYRVQKHGNPALSYRQTYSKSGSRSHHGLPTNNIPRVAQSSHHQQVPHGSVLRRRYSSHPHHSSSKAGGAVSSSAPSDDQKQAAEPNLDGDTGMELPTNNGVSKDPKNHQPW